MWVERLAVEGFRGLHGTFEFAPGLAIVVGPNEAGKSSLHEALVRALHGYTKQERRRGRGGSVRDRYAPWDARGYGVRARVCEGQAFFDVDWDFESHALRLTDERGRDRTDEVVGRGEEVELGQLLFGMGLDDFRQVCCIDQDALLGVRHSPTLGVALQEAVANVAGDVAVEDAIGRLNDALRSIGARTDTLNPTPTGRINATARRRQALRDQIAASEQARERLVAVSSDAARLRAEREERLAQREQLRQRQLRSELQAVGARLEEARRLQEASGRSVPDDSALDEHLVDAVKSARDRLADLESRVAASRLEADAAADAVARLAAEERRLVPIVDGMRVYAEIDSGRESEVRDLWARLSELPEDPIEETEIPERDASLARFRAERAALLTLDRRPARPRLRRALWIAAVVLTAGLAWAVRRVFRRFRPKRPDALAERLAAYGAATIDELDRRCASEDASIAAAEALRAADEERMRALAARRLELAAEIEAALDVAAAPPASLEQRVGAYLAACKGQSDLVEREAELERVRRHRAEAARPLDALARLDHEREEAESRLRASYVAVGIDDASLDDARARLDERLGIDARNRKAAQDAEAAKRALASVLGDETIESLAAKHDASQRAYEDHVAAHGVLGDQIGNAAALAGELASLEDELRDTERRLGELETTAAALEQEVGDPALAKEELTAVEEELRRLTEVCNAVGLARKTLREAADELSREFAPHLNDALRRNLGRITGGRYHEALVDSDLTVKVIVPETGQVVSADDLSRATKDQIFLVERLEIARLLAPTKGPAPLLLDDPFAHYDSERLRYGIEILGETAESRQVILFSEDPAVASLAEEVCASCRVVTLPAPSSVGAPEVVA